MTKGTKTIMGFNVMGILFMLVALFVGNMVGPMLANMIGLAGLLGNFVVGFVIYLIYALVSGYKIQLMQGVIFSVLVFVATLITGFFAFGGIVATLITAIILSFLWGAFGKGKRK